MSDNHISEESSLHKYRTELPNIIDALGLDVYEYRLYCKLKRIAGDKGYCTKSNKNLASECGMSERQLIYSKKSLTIPREILGKTPLITMRKRKSEKGDPDTDLITIKDIWEINFKYFLGGAHSAGGVVHNVQEGGAHSADKEEPIKEEPIKEAMQQCSSRTREDEEKKEFLKTKGFDEHAAAYLAKKHEMDQLKAADLLMEEKEDHGREVKNWHGLFRTLLEKERHCLKENASNFIANANSYKIASEKYELYGWKANKDAVVDPSGRDISFLMIPAAFHKLLSDFVKKYAEENEIAFEGI